ncbi:hypothetical protein [Xanthobacter sediminis]
MRVTVQGLEWLNRLARYVVVTWWVVALAYLVLLIRGTPFDATDAPPARSDMTLLVDHGTGCEYLVARGGGITPRLSATAKQMGCR